MKNKVWILYKREFFSYFYTSVSYTFLIIFLLLSGLTTFYFGNFFSRGQADLLSFFSFHPWLYMLFIPAITMRTWAEERRTGSIELLYTLPLNVIEMVFAKFLAAWSFTGVAIFFTFPLWLTVNYLGNPDNGAIAASYFSSFLMAGGFVAIGTCVSAFTKHQVVAFVISVTICLLFNITGFPLVIESLPSWIPSILLDSMSSFSFISNFDAVNGGLIKLTSVFYFLSLIIFWVFANIIVIETKKANH